MKAKKEISLHEYYPRDIGAFKVGVEQPPTIVKYAQAFVDVLLRK